MTFKLFVQGDSNLIIRQMNGSYSCKSDKLKPLYQKSKSLLQEFRDLGNGSRVSLEHVYRDTNSVADGMYDATCITLDWSRRRVRYIR